MAKDITKVATAGALAGALSPLAMKWIVSPVLGFLGQYSPTITAKLANPQIDINVTQSITGIATGLGDKVVTWMTNALGITLPSNVAMMYIIAAIGGALAFVLGDFLLGMAKLNLKTTLQKMTALIFVSNAAVAVVLALLGGSGIAISLGITTANMVIAMLINAGVLALVFMLLEDNIKKVGLVPY